jgi:hypothetical protein
MIRICSLSCALSCASSAKTAVPIVEPAAHAASATKIGLANLNLSIVSSPIDALARCKNSGIYRTQSSRVSSTNSNCRFSLIVRNNLAPVLIFNL